MSVRRILAAVACLVVLVGAPAAIAAGVTDPFDEQVNTAADARQAEADDAMVDEVEETIDEEEEDDVFDPDEWTEPTDPGDPTEVPSLGVETDLAVYPVDGDELGQPEFPPVDDDLEELQQDTEGHARIWDLFSRITDAEHEPLIDQFVISTDGPLNILAAVAPQPSDPSSWTLFVDNADAEPEGELVATLVHEYAHILTLEPSQIAYDESFLDPSGELADCGQGVPLPEGCALPDSYWTAYFDAFWAPIQDEHDQIDQIADEDEYFAALGEFYQQHQDEFVSDYAVTNQAEDMAETMAVWALDADPQYGGVAQQKIEFFNQFPELVALRQGIRDGLGLS